MLIYTGSAILIIILTIIGVVHGIISGDNNLSKEVFKAFLKMFLLIIVKIWVVQMTIKSVWLELESLEWLVLLSEFSLLL